MSHDIVIVHGWLRSFARCWKCDLRVPVGWRWQIRTQAHGIECFEALGVELPCRAAP